ncbi:hypothetical protein [Nostoc sp. UIC 10630]|uniref:hypothetical protein n=1 Tax=Nostoc sp. UIC 10630 TaxID=2100146 RepID=UPI0013D1C119|nr:hypothetical protein [Nostoc sp. UIC 10630]NEU79669.1 hypothetical protein [Nostoc sp. UIC 10630]
MANDKNLAQLINQEAIFEEINEEELEGIVGGALLDELIPGLATTVTGVSLIVSAVVTRVLNTVATLTL